MRIMFINNNGGGFADTIEISAGTTIAGLFHDKIGGKVTDYLIRTMIRAGLHESVIHRRDQPVGCRDSLSDYLVRFVGAG